MNNLSTLYHYTDIHGLLGIIRDKKIWASRLEYMNDALEGKYLNSLLMKHLSELIVTSESKDKSDGIEVVRNMLHELTAKSDGSDVYVFSLSEKPDLLSQWRGYTPQGGYCIGFGVNPLIEIGRINDLSLHACSYDAENNREIVGNIIDTHFEENVNWPDLETNKTEFLRNCQSVAFRLLSLLKSKSSLMKHESFSEESEWRIHGDVISTNENVKYRASGKYIRPYVELDIAPLLEKHRPHEIITEIIFSPDLDFDLAEGPLLELIDKSGFDVSAIRKSSSPFRA